MKIRTLRRAAIARAWLLALLLAGCRASHSAAPANETASAEIATEAAEAQSVAESVLGKQAEVLARGDLAGNGREQVLAVNRWGATPGNQSETLILRAIVLEKTDGKWAEVFRCDEHLKNPIRIPRRHSSGKN